MSALANVPGLAGYLEAQQQNEARSTGDLQKAAMIQGLLAHMQQQQQADQLRTAMSQSGGDVEKALQLALQSGNVAAAHQLAPLVESKRKERERQVLAGGDMNDPEFLRRAGLALGKPEFVTHAERIEKQREADATLASMRSVQPRVIQPDPQEVAQAADQGTPAVAPAVTPGRPGTFGSLMQSEIPTIAQAAKNYQAQMDSAGAKAIPPQHWLDVQKQLQAQEATQLNMRAMAADRAAAKTSPEAAPPVTDDTLAMDAWRYLTDGTLPPNMGRGVQGTAQATKIRNEASRLAKDMGMTPDEIRMAQLTNKTQVQAIGQLAKAKAQILQFEKTASLNAELALQASEKVDRTGIPVLNRWIQAGRVNVQGDPEASKFNAATETFVSEYARVMSGGYGSAQTTEGAQNRAHTLLNTANTKEQFRGVISQLKAEMGNRVKALNDQMGEERQNLRNGIVRPSPSNPGPAAQTPPAAPQGQQTPEFASEADAAAAAKAGTIQPGDKIKVGGKSGTWR